MSLTKIVDTALYKIALKVDNALYFMSHVCIDTKPKQYGFACQGEKRLYDQVQLPSGDRQYAEVPEGILQLDEVTRAQEELGKVIQECLSSIDQLSPEELEGCDIDLAQYRAENEAAEAELREEIKKHEQLTEQLKTRYNELVVASFDSQ